MLPLPSQASTALHVDLDGAWNEAPLPPMPRLDATGWGARLRYCAPSRAMEGFFSEVEGHLPPFVLYGSGDFHHLSALWQRRVREPFRLVCFDNHPDWDVRPPRWSCGGWMNRALEHPLLLDASVWGCGNFEVRRPWRVFATHRALAQGRLRVYPWTERNPGPKMHGLFPVSRGDWREAFGKQLSQRPEAPIYVSIDLDCLAPRHAVTDWENGLFEPEDLAWALREIRAGATLVGGDLCGARSPRLFARWGQKLASWLDHPNLQMVAGKEAPLANRRSIQRIWPCLVGA